MEFRSWRALVCISLIGIGASGFTAAKPRLCRLETATTVVPVYWAPGEGIRTNIIIGDSTRVEVVGYANASSGRRWAKVFMANEMLPGWVEANVLTNCQPGCLKDTFFHGPCRPDQTWERA